MIYPEDVDTERKELIPSYNRAGALESVEMDGNNYVNHIAYNAQGKRLLIAYENDVMTRYVYDSKTFRIVRQRSEKYIKTDWTYTSDGSVQQDTAHFYDLIGNIIKLNEKTTACGIGGAGSLERIFEYDPLYRILSGTGRENSPTITPIWDDRYRSTDNNTTTGYTQNYSYDKLGNIQVLQHLGNNDFTRNFNYTATNNQLQSIDIGMSNFAFTYDACGNQISETTSRHFEWGIGNKLRNFYVQVGTSEPTQYAQYLYDAVGTRVKKLVRVQGGDFTSRVYIDDVFEYKTDGTNEQNLLHVMDDQARIAMVRLGDTFGDTTPAIKYNIDDYLGNSTVLLETSGALISKEEYYPFGETSFGSYAKKRYKFSGKERDEESGLYYCEYRYHSAWTCRFISVDPLAPKYPNYCSYSFAGNMVVTHMELEGLEPAKKEVGTTTVAIDGVEDFSHEVSVYKPNPRVNVNLENGNLFSDLAEGDVVYVNGETLVAHCGIVKDGEIYGEGFYHLKDYINFAVFPQGKAPYINTNEVNSRIWGYDINTKKSFYFDSNIFELGTYNGVDPNSAEGDILTFYRSKIYYSLPPASGALQPPDVDPTDLAISVFGITRSIYKYAFAKAGTQILAKEGGKLLEDWGPGLVPYLFPTNEIGISQSSYTSPQIFDPNYKILFSGELKVNPDGKGAYHKISTNSGIIRIINYYVDYGLRTHD